MLQLTSVCILALCGSAVQAGERGPWVGIEVGPVPPILSVHLKLGDAGLVVTNVAIGSPAEQVGLEQYDVILELDDQPVSGFTHQFIKKISQRKVGEEIVLFVLHKGDRKEVRLRLGETNPSGDTQWLYARPDREWREDVKVAPPRIFKHNERDGWVEQEADKWSDHVRKLLRQKWGWDMPIGQDMHFGWSQRDGELEIKVVRDGTTIHVKRTADARITVTRSHTEPGKDAHKPVTKEYESEEQLAKDDPEALEILQDASGRGWQFERFFGPGRFNFEFDLDDLGINPGELRQKADEAVDDLRWQFDQWSKELDQIPGLDQLLPELKRFAPAPPKQPAVEFEVDADGAITVVTKRNGRKLRFTLRNEQELADKHADLHKQYKDLMNGVK